MKRHLLILCFICTTLYSCGIDCKKATDAYRDYDLDIILTEEPTIYGDMKFVGHKINSYKISTTHIEGRWFRNYKSFMKIGDTIIKRRGELTMYIHKKDTILIFKHDCQGKIYE